MQGKSVRCGLSSLLVTIALTAVTAISFAWAKASPVHSVTGNGMQLIATGKPDGGQAIEQVNINAYQNADGTAYGTIVWTVEIAFLVQGKSGGPEADGWPYTLAVDTLVIDPFGAGNTNVALVSGIVTKDPQGEVAGNSAVGQRFDFFVVDNGAGGANAPDELGITAPFFLPIMGNYTVR